MKTAPYMLKSALALALAALGASTVQADPAVNKTEKNVTYISAETSADGGSEIAHEKILDCIQSLPDPAKLEAQVSSQAVYVKGVNGEPDRNEWVKSYTAQLDITYLTHEKELIIVTTRNVNGQPPVLREVDKVLRHTQTFVSNSTEGEVYAGRSDRTYYFTKADSAIKDVRERARVWISGQQAAVCPAGTK